MIEYIDREAAKEFFLNMDAGSRCPSSTLLTPEEFAEYLDEIPTADVASVVRCQSCKYYTDYGTNPWCEKLKIEIEPGFYCGFGGKYEWCNGMADMIILGTKTDEERDFYRGIQNEEEK